MQNSPTHCPECGAPLDAEEQALGECYSCGWPQGETPLAEISSVPRDFHPDMVIDNTGIDQ